MMLDNSHHDFNRYYRMHRCWGVCKTPQKLVNSSLLGPWSQIPGPRVHCFYLPDTTISRPKIKIGLFLGYLVRGWLYRYGIFV